MANTSLYKIVKEDIDGNMTKCYIIPIEKYKAIIWLSEYRKKMKQKSAYKNKRLTNYNKQLKSNSVISNLRKKVTNLQSQVNYYRRTMKPRIDNKINEINLLIETLTL